MDFKERMIQISNIPGVPLDLYVEFEKLELVRKFYENLSKLSDIFQVLEMQDCYTCGIRLEHLDLDRTELNFKVIENLRIFLNDIDSQLRMLFTIFSKILSLNSFRFQYKLVCPPEDYGDLPDYYLEEIKIGESFKYEKLPPLSILKIIISDIIGSSNNSNYLDKLRVKSLVSDSTDLSLEILKDFIEVHDNIEFKIKGDYRASILNRACDIVRKSVVIFGSDLNIQILNEGKQIYPKS